MKVNGEIGYKKYQRGKLLGKGTPWVDVGGFAKCYEGTNLETKKLCAIKVIDKVSLQKNRAKQKVILHPSSSSPKSKSTKHSIISLSSNSTAYSKTPTLSTSSWNYASTKYPTLT